MNADELRAAQAPLKQQYRDDPGSAVVHLHARAEIDKNRIGCNVERFGGPIFAGLHVAAGGPPGTACSGDMLLDALVACAGVTLSAVSTAMGIPWRSASVEATADLDFRGTLGIDKTANVGITNAQLRFNIDSDATPEQIEKLIQLTERYCVIYQTLKQGININTVVD